MVELRTLVKCLATESSLQHTINRNLSATARRISTHFRPGRGPKRLVPAPRLAAVRKGGRFLSATGACVAMPLAVSSCASFAADPGLSRLVTGGVAQDPCHPQVALPVPPRLKGQFKPDSSVLGTSNGI